MYNFCRGFIKNYNVKYLILNQNALYIDKYGMILNMCIIRLINSDLMIIIKIGDMR